MDHLRKRGFMISEKQPKELTAILDIECSTKIGRRSVLMDYEKK